MKGKMTFFFLLITGLIFSQTLVENSFLLPKTGYIEGYMGNEFNIQKDEFVFNSEYYMCELYRSSYSFEKQNGMTFLILPDVDKRLLCLANDIVCVLYDEKSDKPYFLGYWSLGGLELIDPFKPAAFSASSELKEGSITYSAGNLASFDQKTPWVEGVAGNGIGEYVSFHTAYQYLYLFSGYISYDKPYLYEQNARPKKIKITITDKGVSQEFIFDLEDTPNPQTLAFPDRMYGDATLEILDVYPGTKYQDTCIHAILGKVF